MARELKPVSFNPEVSKADKEILEYIEELGIPFGSYVKLLIRKDMRAGTIIKETNDVAEIVSQLKELVSVLKAGNIAIGNTSTNDTINETVVTVEEPEETEEERKQRIVMENFLGIGGK